MDVPHLNIDDLYDTKKKNNLTRLDIYNKLLIKIHGKIKMASRMRNNDNFCSYIMPEVLIGYPNYNFDECLLFIIDRLQNDGFLTRYIHPNLLMISWNHWVPSYVRDEIKKKTGKQVNCYGEPLEDKSILKFSDKSENKTEKPKNMYDDVLLSIKDFKI